MNVFKEMIIDSNDALVAFVARSKHPKYLGIDTEFLRTNTYHPRLCLMQIATPDELVVIDCVQLDDLSALRPFLYHSDTTLVFHAFAQDVEILHDVFGVWPKRIYDTQVAEEFLSERIQPSYGFVVREHVHVELLKAETLTNWETRPLQPDEVAYAFDDVRYLLNIANEQMEQLHVRKREKWVQEETNMLYTGVQHATSLNNVWRRVRHTQNLNKKQLGVVKALAQWRETEALKKNKPRRWILSDELIVQFAKHPPKTKDQIERIQGARILSQKAIKAILEAIKKGLRYPEDTFVQENPQLTCSKDVLTLAEALVRSISHAQKISPDMIATKREIKLHLADRESSPLNKGWKKELVGDALTKLMQGKLSLSIQNNSVVTFKTQV